ncbi:MAG: cupredoxin domain-containing protein, partial [Nitrososphaeraceae archaeon]
TAVLILTVADVLISNMPTTTTLSTGTRHSVIAQVTTDDTIQVDAGGGNATGPLTVYIPQNVTVEVGQSIIWINPTTVGEPHSVTFLKESSLFPPYVVPFAVPSTTEFRALLPNPNIEPLVVPNPPGANNETEKTVIINNGRVFNPLVIDSKGQNITNLPLNARYRMDGTETYINSGWIWPEGQVFPGAPPITSFTVTFEKPGTYPYICTVHPWMTGTVEVT